MHSMGVQIKASLDRSIGTKIEDSTERLKLGVFIAVLVNP